MAATLRVAHTAIVTPHRAGLYETARELVQYERQLGIEARIVDPKRTVTSGDDRGVPIADEKWAKRAQVLVSHSGLSSALNSLNKPIVHMLHGRPYSSFLLEQSGQIAVYSYWRKVAGDPRFCFFVTFWEEFVPYFANVLPAEKVRAIPAPVDLERWSPQGPRGYGFHGKGGAINLVVTDMWREDKTPYHVINAAMVYARMQPGVKVHIYGAPQKGTAWGVLKAQLDEAGVLGECVGFVTGLEHVYRAADALISPQRIATRSVREALACGCQVVMANRSSTANEPYTPYMAEPEDLEGYALALMQAVHDRQQYPDERRGWNRRIAEQYFDPQNTARAMAEILREVSNGGQ